MSVATAPRHEKFKTAVSHLDFLNGCLQKRINHIARAIEHRFMTRTKALEAENETLRSALSYYKNLVLVKPVTLPANTTTEPVKSLAKTLKTAISPSNPVTEPVKTFIAPVKTLTDPLNNNNGPVKSVTKSVNTVIIPVNPVTEPSEPFMTVIEPENTIIPLNTVSSSDKPSSIPVKSVIEPDANKKPEEDFRTSLLKRFYHEPEILMAAERNDPGLTNLNNLTLTLYNVEDTLIELKDHLDETEKPISNRKLNLILNTNIHPRINDRERFKQVKTYFHTFAMCYYALNVNHAPPLKTLKTQDLT